MQDLASFWTTLNLTLGSCAAQLPFHLTSEEELKLWDGLQTTRQPERKSASLTPLERTGHSHGGGSPPAAPNEPIAPACAGVARQAPRGGKALHSRGCDPANSRIFCHVFSPPDERRMCSHPQLGAKGLGRDNRGNGTPGRLLLPLPFAPPPLTRLPFLI